MVQNFWKPLHSVGLSVLIIAIIVCGWLFPLWFGKFWAWVITLSLLTSFTIVAGHGITGRTRGLLIDERNKLSLSRLQMILWTIVLLSGYLTAGLSNLAGKDPSPLAIAIPGELWLLMGISTISLVGSPLIKSTKKTNEPEDNEKKGTLQLLQKQGIAQDSVENIGQIVKNKELIQARWSDLFKGEETGTAAHLDLAKVQMFFFTLIVVFAYASALGTLFVSSTGIIKEFPALDESIVALIGISHAGYLTYKAVPHSKTA